MRNYYQKKVFDSDKRNAPKSNNVITKFFVAFKAIYINVNFYNKSNNMFDT